MLNECKCFGNKALCTGVVGQSGPAKIDLARKNKVSKGDMGPVNIRGKGTINVRDNLHCRGTVQIYSKQCRSTFD